jgi:hypothetical protein
MNFEDGVLDVLSNWDEFVSLSASIPSDYVWRGHQNESWELKSLLDRELSAGKIPLDGKRRDNILESVLQTFKRRISELAKDTSALKEVDIWALGQHYGLPTPFLDWTINPYIAAYFAFRKKDTMTQSRNRVVIALRKETKRLILKTKSRGKVLKTERYVEFPGITGSTIDTSLNTRMKAQEGVFTNALNGRDISDNVKDYYRRKFQKTKQEEVFLIKILLPSSERKRVLSYLRTEKKIFDGKLFPDYSGAAEISRDELLE